MPSWFKKVFSGDAAKPKTAAPKFEEQGTVVTPVATPPSVDNPALGKPNIDEHEKEASKQRKVVNAPILVPEDEQSGWSEDVRIKAQVEAEGTTCKFLVDRPVLDGLSAWFPSAQWAGNASQLAEKLFEVDGVGSVMLHEMTFTIGLADGNTRPWEDLAAEAGAVVREFLKSGEDIVSPAFRDNLPPVDEIRQKVQACIDLEINPGISGHGGVVTLERVTGNSVYLTMGGGCQGCAASAITLRQGIHTTFRKAVPQIGGIFDETDHTAGTNPFFKELPAGMS
jgi:Fe-S cluster biogenesis protein NfuA